MAKKKILISDKLAQAGVDILNNVSDFEVDVKLGMSPEELSSVIGEYDAIVIRSGTKLTKDILQNAHKLKAIGRAGVGLDNVDIKEATKCGIIVMNAPSGNSIATCEQTFALMLALARNTSKADQSLREGKWERSKLKGTELYGKKLGVIGLGRVGREVAKRALGFEMKVSAFDPFISEDLARKLDIEIVELDELLKNSDYITIHTPLSENTKDLISDKEFEMMKPSARILNCARGGIINEDSLYKALSENKIAGGALDVYTQEPMDKNSPLLKLGNIVLTPHLGASTKEAQLNVAVEIAECIRDSVQGKSLRNAVNFPSLDPETFKVLSPYIGLAEKLGLISAKLIEGRIKKATLVYTGEITSFKLVPVTSACAKGLLTSVVEESVNFINSLDLVKERGIGIEERKSSESTEFINSVGIKVESDKGGLFIEGTLFADLYPRIVKIDDFYVEVTPSEYMAFIRNKDKAGVIGKLGSMLGKHGINIASMSFGRQKKGADALTILTVDNPFTDEVEREILADSDFSSVKFLKLQQ